jgi:hypothetical protein
VLFLFLGLVALLVLLLLFLGLLLNVLVLTLCMLSIPTVKETNLLLALSVYGSRAEVGAPGIEFSSNRFVAMVGTDILVSL